MSFCFVLFVFLFIHDYSLLVSVSSVFCHVLALVFPVSLRVRHLCLVFLLLICSFLIPDSCFLFLCSSVSSVPVFVCKFGICIFYLF